jgi:ABC-type multidrug transport system permease subunit
MPQILTLYAQRPIVEKHSQYAFYHPSCEAVASMLTDLPYKIMNAITFNLVIYFMVRQCPLHTYGERLANQISVNSPT